MPLTDSFKYFSENLIGPYRDRLLFIAGSLSPFEDLFDMQMVYNQIVSADYDPQKPQSVYYSLAEKSNDPDCGVSFIISPDESVIVQNTFLWNKNMPGETETEEYEMSLDDLHNWLKAQPPKWKRFTRFI